MMLGLGAGLELGRAGITWRPQVGVYRGVGPFGDHLSICLGASPACYEPAYSRTAATGGLDVVVAPRWGHGLFAAVGGGLTLFSQRSAEASSLEIPRSRGHWRAGAGITIGSGRRAPRLEIARTTFANAAGSARRWTSFGLWLR